MPFKIAVMGFRHGHIYDLVNRLKGRDDAILVAACEEDNETRDKIMREEVSDKIFDSYQQMLDEVECDAIGVGDYFGKRGAIAIEALRRSKHVISDKPLCTSLRELDEIQSLAYANNLSVGCQLDLRGNGAFCALRSLIQAGEIGEAHAISFNGQHPLNYGTRAGWYFEEGKHGGTINDIAVHAIDYIPWLTGHDFRTINAARNWNARLPEVPHFKDAAQMMLTLENGCGVLGDVSYLTPDSFAYGLPQYWRTTVWGADGMAETSYTSTAVTLYKNGDKEPRTIAVEEVAPGGYLESFLREARGETAGLDLTTERVLHVSRIALLIQEAADKGVTNVAVHS